MERTANDKVCAKAAATVEKKKQPNRQAPTDYLKTQSKPAAETLSRQ